MSDEDGNNAREDMVGVKIIQMGVYAHVLRLRAIIYCGRQRRGLGEVALGQNPVAEVMLV